MESLSATSFRLYHPFLISFSLFSIQTCRLCTTNCCLTQSSLNLHLTHLFHFNFCQVFSLMVRDSASQHSSLVVHTIATRLTNLLTCGWMKFVRPITSLPILFSWRAGWLCPRADHWDPFAVLTVDCLLVEWPTNRNILSGLALPSLTADGFLNITATGMTQLYSISHYPSPSI